MVVCTGVSAEKSFERLTPTTKQRCQLTFFLTKFSNSGFFGFLFFKKMKAFTLVLIAAIAVQAYAGHHHGGVHEDFVGKEILTSSRPEAIDESERSKTCPHGFKKVGKQCAQTVTTKPTVHCPTGTVRSVDDEDVCAKFFDKVHQCPSEFVREKGICVRTRQTDALVQCPQHFTLTSDGHECSRAVALPKVLFCPPGTVQRGEGCVRKVPVAPEIVCPPGFTLEDKQCRIVETFDCTPNRVHIGKEEHVESSHHHHGGHHLRLLGEHGGKKHHSTPVSFVGGKEVAPTDEQFVVQKTCKRVRTEGARKVCPKGARLHGKECIAEEEVGFQEKNGGMREEVVRAKYVCPEGHYPSASVGRFHCLIKEEVAVHGFCPDGSENVGDKCAKFRPLIFRCPSSYALDDGMCVKTVIAPPIVEFSVTFKCTGKDCDHKSHDGGVHHDGGMHHHH